MSSRNNVTVVFTHILVETVFIKIIDGECRRPKEFIEE